MFRYLILIAFSVSMFCGCRKEEQSASQRVTLKIYSGAGLRLGVDQLAEAFTKKTGIDIELDYAGSGISLTRVKEDSEADLFLPGDVYYVDRLNELTGKVVDKTIVSYFVPTIIVQKGNPKNIQRLKDFEKRDLKIGLGNPKSCQIGRLANKIFKKNSVDVPFDKAMLSLTVNELGIWVKTQNVDTAIVWDAIAANIAEDIEAISIPKEDNIISNVAIALLKTSKHPEQAKEFVKFMTSKEGKKILKNNGFRVEAP